MNQKQVSVSFMLMGILFCVCLVASNMLETKVVQLGPVSLTAGFLVFPISYIINDCIAEVWGFKKARLIIWMGFMMNFFVALMGLLAVALPATSYWSANEPHFNFVFSLAPRVTIASFLAFLVGSFLNAYVMSKMKLAMEGKHFSWRAVVSTLVGEGADSLIFFPLAFAGLMPFNEVLKLMVIQVVAKTLYEIIALPLTIRVVKKVKEIEGTDVYDKDISYNILNLKDL
jgi:uncharacterized integral membrane protein (TIGR00697 family)